MLATVLALLFPCPPIPDGLDSRSWHVREQAQRKLEALPPQTCYRLFRRARQEKNPEVRQRIYLAAKQHACAVVKSWGKPPMIDALWYDPQAGRYEWLHRYQSKYAHLITHNAGPDYQGYRDPVPGLFLSWIIQGDHPGYLYLLWWWMDLNDNHWKHHRHQWRETDGNN